MGFFCREGVKEKALQSVSLGVQGAEERETREGEREREREREREEKREQACVLSLLFLFIAGY